MKSLLYLLIIGISQFSHSQNDSIIPNLYGIFCIETMTQEPVSPTFSTEHISFVNDTPSEDTLSVLYEGDTIATLAIDGEQVYIKRTAYPFNPVYFGFRPDFGNDYEILYDFSLNVGDTAYSQYSPNDAIVQSIDFVNIQGVQRKRLNLTNGEAWIMGMGSTFHPLSPKMYYFEVGYSLCYAEMEYFGASPIDTNSFAGICNCTAGMDEMSILDKTTIFPNPTNQKEVHLRSNFEILDIQAINIDGKTYPIHYNSSNKTLDVSALRDGIYFIRIQSAGQIEWRKLIITEM